MAPTAPVETVELRVAFGSGKRLLVVAGVLAAATLATERSAYEFALTMIFLSFLTAIGAAARSGAALLSPPLPMAALRIAFYVALASLLVVAQFNAAFGLYLNGGTMYVGHTPFVLDGNVTWPGKLYVAFYSLAVAISVAVLCEKPLDLPSGG